MATVSIRIPAVLQPYADGQSRLQTEAATVAEAITKLCAVHERLRPRLFEPDGGLRRFVNVFVGETRVRHGDGLARLLGDGDVITILPAVAGG